MQMPAALRVLKKIKRSILFWLVIVLIGIIILYNVLLSSWFITKVGLVILSQESRLNFAAGEVNISLIDGTISVKDFVFGPGWDPVVKAKGVSAGFSVAALLTGRFDVFDVAVDTADVVISRNRAGLYNIRPVRRGPPTPDYDDEYDYAANAPFYLKVENIQLKNSSFRFVYIDNGGMTDADVWCRNLDIKIDRFGNELVSNIHIIADTAVTADGVDLKHSAAELFITAKFAPGLLPEKVECKGGFLDMQGVANNVDLNGKDMKIYGSAYGRNVLWALEVYAANVDIYNSDKSLAAGIKISSVFDFYPWIMESKITVSPLSEELSSYVGGILGVNINKMTARSINDFSLNDEEMTIDGKISMADNDFAKLDGDYLLKWKFNDDQLHAERLNASLQIDNRQCAELELINTLNFDYAANMRFAAEPIIKITLNSMPLNRLCSYFEIPAQNIVNGDISGQITVKPGINIDKMKIQGYCMGRNVQLALMDYPVLDNLNSNISFAGSVDASGNLYLANFESVFSRNGESMAVVQLKESLISLARGDVTANISVGGINESIFNVQPLAGYIGSVGELQRLLPMLQPLNISGSGRICFQNNENLLSVEAGKIRVYSKGTELLQFEIEDNQLDLSKNQLVRNLSGVCKIWPMDVRLIEQVFFSNDPAVEFIQGMVSGEFKVSSGERFSDISIDGGIAAESLTFSIDDFGVNCADLTSEINVSVNDFKNIEVCWPVATLRSGQRKMLDCGGKFNYNSTVSQWSTAIEVRELNELLLAEFGLKLKLPITINGVIAADGNLRQGYCAAAELKSQKDVPGEPLMAAVLLKVRSAKEGFEVEESAVSLAQGGRLLGEVKIKGAFPRAAEFGSEAWLAVNSKQLAVKELFGLLKGSGGNQETVLPLSAIKVPILVDLVCDDVSWGGDATSNWRGSLLLDHDVLNIERMFLRFNGAEMKLKGTLRNINNATAYQIEATAEDAELSALLAPLLPEGSGAFRATVDRFKLHIAGLSIHGADFWNTQQGTLEMDLGVVQLPNTLGSTTLGRILFLPFSIAINLPGLLPTNVDKIGGLIHVSNMFKRFYRSTGRFDFADGHVLLRSSEGRIMIEDFILHGDPITAYRFGGSFGLGTNSALEMESVMEFSGLSVPVRIGGNLDNPKVNYAAGAVDIMTMNLKNMVGIFDISKWVKSETKELK